MCSTIRTIPTPSCWCRQFYRIDVAAVPDGDANASYPAYTFRRPDKQSDIRQLNAQMLKEAKNERDPR
ncbi:hypothetical protein TUM17580_01030 [Citrobacter farmeri]|nr:hypothetical protein TUM17580_01030 [Citrobacter farmeri]